MKCPRCGADNADHAEWCYLCEYPFRADIPGKGISGAPQESVRLIYSQPGQAPDYPQSLQGQPPGYPPTMPGQPPGAYPPGYAMAPPAKDSRTTRVLIGILAIIGLIVLGGATLISLHKNPTISLPAPPGYQETSEVEKKSIEAAAKANSSETVLDLAYVNDLGDSAVVVAHLNTPVPDVPASDDSEAVEEYYQKNKDELLKGFNLGLERSSGLDGDITLYEVERLSCGDMALHIKIGISMTQTAYTIDFFIITKVSTTFLVTLQGAGYSNPQSTVDFLTDNISFE